VTLYNEQLTNYARSSVGLYMSLSLASLSTGADEVLGSHTHALNMAGLG